MASPWPRPPFQPRSWLSGPRSPGDPAAEAGRRMERLFTAPGGRRIDIRRVSFSSIGSTGSEVVGPKTMVALTL